MSRRPQPGDMAERASSGNVHISFNVWLVASPPVLIQLNGHNCTEKKIVCVLLLLEDLTAQLIDVFDSYHLLKKVDRFL